MNIKWPVIDSIRIVDKFWKEAPELEILKMGRVGYIIYRIKKEYGRDVTPNRIHAYRWMGNVLRKAQKYDIAVKERWDTPKIMETNNKIIKEDIKVDIVLYEAEVKKDIKKKKYDSHKEKILHEWMVMGDKEYIEEMKTMKEKTFENMLKNSSLHGLQKGDLRERRIRLLSEGVVKK